MNDMFTPSVELRFKSPIPEVLDSTLQLRLAFALESPKLLITRLELRFPTPFVAELHPCDHAPLQQPLPLQDSCLEPYFTPITTPFHLLS